MKVLPVACVALLLTGTEAVVKKASFAGVTLSYSASLCATIEVERVPAQEWEGVDWEGPEHLSFIPKNSYSSKHSPSSYIVPEVRIYRVEDFRKTVPEITAETLAQLRFFLERTGEVRAK